MGNERSDSDLELECQILVEYGQALAAAAEGCLRYPDRMSHARSEDERAHVRREHGRFLRRTIDANAIALSVLDTPRKGMKMPHWLKLVTAALGVAGAVVATIASGGTAALAIGAGLSAATGALATLYHPTPGSGETPKS